MTSVYGRVMAIDVGSVRVGVAVSDPEGRLASPWATVTVPAGGVPVDAVTDVVAHIAETGVTTVVVGLPLALSGRETAAAVGARHFAVALAQALAAALTDPAAPVAVRLLDERYTTTTAHQRLAAAGRRASNRRDVIDQAAAVVLLQHALDIHAHGSPAGQPVVTGTTVDRVAT